MSHNFFTGFLDDLRVELTDLFDRNFERKAFFDQPWPAQQSPVRRGSLLIRSGALRRSIRSTSRGQSIVFSSSLPYASLQNDGGTIIVTEKMRRYFWAMHRKAAGASSGKGARARRFSLEAEFFKAMALKKVGSRITIPARTFIGPHREVDMAVERTLDRSMREFAEIITKSLKP